LVDSSALIQKNSTRRYLVFASVALVLVVTAIGGTAVSVAFKNITEEMSTSLITAGWVLSIHQLVATAAMPLAGKASDIFGRKRVFIFCLILWLAGSLFSALAPNITLLIVARFIQAVGGGGFLPCAAGIVADEFPNSRQQAIGMLSSIFPIGQIIGPNLGGWLVSTWDWRMIFWVNIPLGIISLIVCVLLLKHNVTRKSSLDIKGAALFTGAVCLLMAGLGQFGNSENPTAWIIAVIMIISSLLMLGIFIRVERKVASPIIDMNLFRQRPFAAANIYNIILGATYFGAMAFIPLYAVNVFGMSTLGSGAILTPRSIGMIAGSAIISLLLVRWGYRKPMLIGSCGIVLSLVFLALESPGVTVFGMDIGFTLLLLVIMLLIGISMGVTAPAANNACIELMPDRIGTITGIRGMFRQGGGAVSVAVITVVLTNVGDPALGFRIVFFGMAVLMALGIPFILMMPASGANPVGTTEES